MKKLLLPLLLIIALPVLAQENESEYRISKIFSSDCGEEELFSYDNETSTQVCCVRRTSELHESESVDSLFYNDSGQLIKKTSYMMYEYPYLEKDMSLVFSYNDKGQRIRCDIYSSDDYNEFSFIYVYDEKDRLEYMETIYAYDEWRERMDFAYNENNLMISHTYSSDYGDGEGFIAEEITTYEYNENNSLTKEVYYYVDGEDLYNEGEYIYEYDEYNNCISSTEYYDNEIVSKTEYVHDLEISSDAVHTYTDPEEDYLVLPTHSNIITKAIRYGTDENYEFYVDCEFMYKYDELSVSVEENVIAFEIYPNPAEDFINIKAENIELVELYDIYGRKLYSQNTNDNAIIDINAYDNGIYFVKIYSEGKSSVKKIVKK